MASQQYKIPRLSDEQIATALTKLGNDFGSFSINVQVFDSTLDNVMFPEAAHENWNHVLAQKSDLISSFHGAQLGVRIIYNRGFTGSQPHELSPIFDGLLLDTQGFDPQKLRVAARCLELFRPVQLPIPSTPIDLLESQRALQESTFGRLERQLENVFEQTIDLRAKLDEQINEKETNLQKKFDDQSEIAAAEIQKVKEELNREKEQLEARKKLLDDSDNTFARRQIRDRMLADVSERVQNFGVSNATMSARSPVAKGMVVLGVFLMAMAFFASYEIADSKSVVTASSNNALVQTPALAITNSATASASRPSATTPMPLVANPTQWNVERLLLWLRLTLLTFGAVATLIYYIRWQNQWATNFASTEQGLKQFHLDVNRANWVVETCLEWRKENESDIPPELVASLTRGLFVSRDSQIQVLHPADELASAIMGTASKLSLDIGGNKLEIDKPKNIPNNITVKPKVD
jgi:Skp family chaperone for outer membrane proteins